ncbi:MAG: efflux transporter outer membrane subunit [Caulobacteraceae bacterium]
MRWNRTGFPIGVSLTALVIAMELEGCAAVGPDFKRPVAPAEAGYAMAGEQGPSSQHATIGAKVAQDWWGAFHSPELDRAMRQALANNPDIAVADATLLAARADLAAARGQRLPQVDLDAGVERERLNFATFGFDTSEFPGIQNNPELSIYSVGASVSYALDVFGGLRRNQEAAAARADAQAHRLDAAYLALTGQVATQAAIIAAIRAEIVVVEQVTASDRRNIELVRSAQRAGGVAEGARVNAQAQADADNALLPPLEQQLTVARHALAVLVGKAPADYSAPDFDLATLPLPADIPVSVPSDLVRQRPDILQAEADLHAATAYIGVQTAKLYPRIDLSAGLTQSALQPEHIFDWPSTAYTLGAGLSAPVFHGGQLKAQRQSAQRQADAAAAAYRSTVLHAFGQVADTLQALSHDEAELAAEQRTEQSAAATLRLDTLAYREGGQGLLPVVDAQRQVDSARLRVVQVQARRYLDTIQLFVATGRGWRGEQVARR